MLDKATGGLEFLGFQPSFGKIFLNGLEHTLDGEADDVTEGALNALDEAAFVFLGGVGAGFVEGIDVAEVGVEVDFSARAELDAGGLDEAAHFLVSHEADAGEDFVDTTGKSFQHGVGLGEVGGFAEDALVESDQGIGTEHEAAGEAGGDFVGLAVGVEQAEFAGGPRATEEFVDLRRLDLVWDAGLLEQVAAAGRAGG